MLLGTLTWHLHFSITIMGKAQGRSGAVVERDDDESCDLGADVSGGRCGALRAAATGNGQSRRFHLAPPRRDFSRDPARRAGLASPALAPAALLRPRPERCTWLQKGFLSSPRKWASRGPGSALAAPASRFRGNDDGLATSSDSCRVVF